MAFYDDDHADPVDGEVSSPVPFERRRLHLQPYSRKRRNYNLSAHHTDDGVVLAWRAQQDLGQPSELWIGFFDLDRHAWTAPPRKLPVHATSPEDPRLFSWRGHLAVSYASVLDASVVQEVCLLDGDLTPKFEWLFRSPFGRALEKNWLWFTAACGVHLLYKPHIVLRVAGSGSRFFARELGDIRGGAPPVRVGDEYYCFAHATSKLADAHNYSAVLYTFAASRPFAVRRVAQVPILVPCMGDTGDGKKVVYPCGAVLNEEAGAWTVAYGLHDRYAELARFDFDDLESLLEPVDQFGGEET